jgi:YD repeat-containing protein
MARRGKPLRIKGGNTVSDETTIVQQEIGQVTFTSTGNTTHVDLDYQNRKVMTSNSNYRTTVDHTAEQARTNAEEHRTFAKLMDTAANELDDTDNPDERPRRYHIGEITFASNGNVTTVEYDDQGRVVVTDSQGARRTWTPAETRRLAEDHSCLVHMLMLAAREAETPF